MVKMYLDIKMKFLDIPVKNHSLNRQTDRQTNPTEIITNPYTQVVMNTDFSMSWTRRWVFDLQGIIIQCVQSKCKEG